MNGSGPERCAHGFAVLQKIDGTRLALTSGEFGRACLIATGSQQ